MILTTQQIMSIDHSVRSADAAKYIDYLNEAMEYFDINTKNRVAAFLAQCLHESAHLKAVVENLNYSAEGLMKTFNTSKITRFTPAQAAQYARHPEMIANRVYANRNGNGNEASGDGWRFRGQGLIQLTFRDTHQAYADFMQDQSIMEEEGQLQIPYDACYSACWFFAEYKRLLDDADAGTDASFNIISYRTNGGWRGKAERLALYHSAKAVL